MLSLPDFQAKTLLLIFSDQHHLRFGNENLILEDKQRKEVINQVSCHKLFAVYWIGNATLTSVLLEKAQKYAFSVFFLKANFLPYAQVGALTEGNTLLKKKQYLQGEQHQLARQLVHNKIHNQRENLKKLRPKSPALKDSLRKMKQWIDNLNKIDQNDLLLGMEGNASKIYFKHYFEPLGWTWRKPRTRCDPVNTLLDIGYTLLFHFIEAQLRLYGFDPYQGIYHRLFYQRKSLVCDLVEPFRPIIDHCLRNAYQRKQFKTEDFEIRKGRHELKSKKRRPYTQTFATALLANKESIFRYIQAYYRAFMQEKPPHAYPYFDLCSSSVTTFPTTKSEPDSPNT